MFLVDHAWSFRQRECEKTLRENPKLLERMENILRFPQKLQLPSNPYAAKPKTLEEKLAEVTGETLELDLDSMGISNLDALPLHENLETLSLMFNNIENPGQMTSKLLELPNLKALWLNENPVVETCANFNLIGEHFPVLEVLNSKFTSKAAEWALMYYGKAKNYEEVE